MLSLFLQGQEGLIKKFPIEFDPIEITRLAQPDSPFDKLGPKFAILGSESGSFEAWAYPLKLLRNFTFSFFLRSSTRPIRGADIVRTMTATPAATRLTFVHQSFSVHAVFLVSQSNPGALILLEVDSDEPLGIVCGFLPVLQPMWPAGLGGQYTYWDDQRKAYLISESSRRNHSLVGSPAASGLSYTPAHMLADSPNEFRIDVPDPRRLQGKVIPIVLAGGKGKREEVAAVYDRLLREPEAVYRESRNHFQSLRDRTLRIVTPDPQVNLAVEWAKVAYDGLMVDNPDLGAGMVAGLGISGTSGRPGFGWFFGGDTFINSYSLDALGNGEAVRRALAFNRKWQRPDGKMAHELSQGAGYIDWFKDYGYAYIHADTTPFYITAVHDFFRSSGDKGFLTECWPSLIRAFAWCRSTDANGDGLMDNRRAGLGGVEYGELTGIETDIYLASIWVQATAAMAEMAQAMGDAKTAQLAESARQLGKTAFEEKFWDEAAGFYSFGFSDKGERVREITPTAALGLMWELGDPERSRRTLERLCRADMLTDWGIRSISAASRFYQPLNYNYGAVWPFNNSWVATALLRHGLHIQGFNLWLATTRHTFSNNLGMVTEVFSGDRHTWPQEAVSHQGFSSAGVVLPLVRGLLGLETDARQRRLIFRPVLPGHWDQVRIERIRCGGAEFRIDYKREPGRVIIDIDGHNCAGFQARLAPGLGIGSRLDRVTAADKPVPASEIIIGQVKRYSVDRTLEPGKTRMVFSFTPGVELLPPDLPGKIGDPNLGLKIGSMRSGSGKLIVQLQGRAGLMYTLPVLHPELIRSVTGGSLDGNLIRVEFPPGDSDEFIDRELIITADCFQ